MQTFVYRLYQELQQKKALVMGDGILVSLSGGPDSMAMYHFLGLLESELDLKLVVIHFNHKVRPESEAEEEFVRAECKKRGHELLVFSPEQPLTGNFQEAARNWRKEILTEQLPLLKCNKIALGHQADDLSETILFRLLRGASLFRLQPFSIFDDPIIRPLLPLSKAEILTWLAREKVDFVTDESNEETAYKRNEIRLKAAPLLGELAGGKLNERLGAVSDEAGELKELFDSQISAKAYQCEALRYESLDQLPSLLAKEVILRFLNHHSVYELHMSQIKEIYTLVKANKGGWRLNIKGGVVSGKEKMIHWKKTT